MEERYEFLSPGRFNAHFEVSLLRGETLVSADFTLEVVGAAPSDTLPRDRICFRHASFLEGRDRPIDPRDYDGRQLDGKVDVSRFGELQKILDEFPNSTYAHWIRFWKFYHHGPVDDALDYARQHRAFPLSDNLVLHMAEGLTNSKDYAKARALIEELKRDFPEGDTRAGVKRLEERLIKKP